MNYSVEAIVKEVFGMWNDLSRHDQEESGWLECSKEDLIQYHNTVGQNIRNEFNLWEKEWIPEIEDGVDVSPDHPDAISLRVMEEVWELIHSEDA